MDTDTLRRLIADRIAASGLSQYTLAEAAGVPRATLRDYLAGADTGVDRVLRLAAAVGVVLKAEKKSRNSVRPALTPDG